MKVLITGVGGFIANNIANWLYEHSEHEIIGTYRYHEPIDAAYPYIQCDLLTDPVPIKNLQFDAVIHFASQLYGDNIKTFLDNTVQVTRNILDIANRKNIKKFVYISSVSVCGETNGIINENSDRINQNNYEITKWIGEKLLLESDICINDKIILRLPRVLGKGIDYSAPWLPRISYSIMKNEDIKYYNPELKYNVLIHTDNLAEFINHIIEQDRNFNDTYVLGSKEEMSVLDILNYLKENLHSKSNLIEIAISTTNRCHLVDISNAKYAGFKADTVKNVLDKYIKDMKGDNRNAGM